MKACTLKIFLMLAIFLAVGTGSVAFAQEPPPQQAPDDVAGSWTIYSKGARGVTATQHIMLKQVGGVLGGHFKGPHQSGGLAGTINIHHIVFRTKTREPLTFRGRVDGNTIRGAFHDRQGTGEWEAIRSN